VPGVPVFAFSLVSLGASTIAHLVTDLLGQLTRWVATGAGALLRVVGNAIGKTTSPDFGQPFHVEFSVMVTIAAAVVFPLLLLAVIRAVLHQDTGEILRIVFIRLPAAGVLTVCAEVIVKLGLGISDEMSSALLGAASGGVDNFISGFIETLAVVGGVTPGGSGLLLGGVGALLVVVIAALVAFMLWIELALRSAAVLAATLFLPLAIAGIVWPVTSHWAKRLAETLVALIFSKVVIAGTLALGAEMATQSSTASGIISGLALLVLSMFSPFALLRLVPFVESGAVEHLDALARRGTRTALAPAMGPAKSLLAAQWGDSTDSGSDGPGLAPDHPAIIGGYGGGLGDSGPLGEGGPHGSGPSPSGPHGSGPSPSGPSPSGPVAGGGAAGGDGPGAARGDALDEVPYYFQPAPKWVVERSATAGSVPMMEGIPVEQAMRDRARLWAEVRERAGSRAPENPAEVPPSEESQ